eukprot:TRINITY_DN24300_c0_g1_i2.p3 TRINITY_DN24300_c0_g1~~TRINITY_DN24300_c0_g1_i2.p3  ORF type:complete len:101 (-),score=20.91 TRINITY_DN24300_c0_g1_i2:113-415(-)
MVLDMWLVKGPVETFPQIVHMLTQGLHSEVPSNRVRVFDFLHNLAIHMQMLYNAEEGTDLAMPIYEKEVNVKDSAQSWAQTIKEKSLAFEQLQFEFNKES